MLHSCVTHLIIGGGGGGGGCESFGETIGYFHLGGGGDWVRFGAFTGYQARMRTLKSRLQDEKVNAFVDKETFQYFYTCTRF
jgi:hypothetical protein